MTFDTDMLELPRDRKTMNATNRFYYKTEQVISSVIDRHNIASLGGSRYVNDGKIRFVAPDDVAQIKLNDLVSKKELLMLVSAIAHDYWTIGEVFPYAELVAYPDVGAMTIINPDQIRVKKVLDGPDQMLLTADKLKDDFDTPQPSQESISHLKMLASPYDIRGTSVIVSVYEDLERLRSAYFAQEIRKDDSDQGHIDLMIEAIKTKLMFGDEATRQAKYADFRLALIEWFEKIMNQVPELAGSTIKFD